ncbi:MAG: LysR family transcriptional regulator [Nitrososphaerota archaeon]|nr:LysR family transcriptional regulator [Candidatus Bathyarchaeota archaeon]MDW8023380.1 LysR family transcriptional regulator [Nitrososphaerota archaeon]
MSNKRKHEFSCKVWLEFHGKPLIGKGGAEILERIDAERSISKTAKKLGMSYRYVWSYLKRIEKTLGEPIIETHRGGRAGGGGAKLTRLGKELLKEYKRIEEYLNKALANASR